MADTTNPRTVTVDSQQKAMDEAAEHAKHRAAAPGNITRVVLIVAVIAVAAFLVGRQTRTGGVHNAPATAAQGPESHSSAPQRWTCSMHPQVIQSEPGLCPICHMELTPLKTDGSVADGAVSIDPVIVQNMGVRVAEVTRGPIVQAVRVVGYLEEPEPLHRDVNLRVNGWIEKLYANIDGMVIHKGQPLFELYSPELTIAIDEMIAARRQAERAPEDTSTRSMLSSARRKLSQLGLTDEQITEFAKAEGAPKTVPILSPMDGHLTSKAVYEGASVKAGDLVMRLASRYQIWVDAQVPEQQMSLISDGQPVRATLVSQPGKVYSGKVLFVHPHMDPQTRTALVRVEIENQDLALRQGMYATVEILADSYREAPLVPREAVIDTGRRQLAFVSLGEGRFAPRDLVLGLPGKDGTVEVVEGLNVGDTVVTSGQFLLDSESRLKEAVAKHLSGGLPGHTGHAAPAVPETPMTTETAPKARPSTRPAADLIAVPHADDIVQAYLVIAEGLGARQEADTPLDVSPLVAVASMAAQHAKGDAAALAQSIEEAAKAMGDKTLAQQREVFVPLSDAVVALARRARLSKEIAPTLYVMHCPMAFEDKGADWLQAEETIANPYYATQMKRCGEVVERIQPGK